MPSPKHRSRSLRRVFVKTASSVKLHYRKRNIKKPKCPECGKLLSGTVRTRATKLRQVPKTKKAPSRKFGNLCVSCSRKKLIDRARKVKW